MEPKTSRWHRNYSKVAEYYYKWEIDVMRKPEFIYDIEALSQIITLPKLVIPKINF